MVTYEYRCQACGKEFTHQERISEHGLQGSPHVRCPACESSQVEQIHHSAVYVKTSRKS